MGLELFNLRVVKTDYTRTMNKESVPKKPLGCSFFAVDFHLPAGVGQSRSPRWINSSLGAGRILGLGGQWKTGIRLGLIRNWVTDLCQAAGTELSWRWRLLLFVKHRNYCPSNTGTAAKIPQHLAHVESQLRQEFCYCDGSWALGNKPEGTPLALPRGLGR